MASSTVQPTTTTPITTTTTSTLNPHENQNQNQIPVVPNLPPQPPSSSSLPNNNNYSSNFNPKKRTLDYDYLFQSSPYFKMRIILKDLRPLFLEVLRAPDLQKCEASRSILEKMKLMVDLCRQQTTENVPLAKSYSRAGTADLASERQGGNQKPADQPPQEKRFPVGNSHEKPMHGSNRIPGTYIVGGSAFGWNFITFHGTKPEYYGRTKETFRAGK
ncbi:hypothetical protein BVRB_1g004820 [Beta vulgaris subsp. vulgaris]|nr:hypothetical protein BVRB_1g004820 [Beta vulgaris subsp. vulgaris]